MRKICVINATVECDDYSDEILRSFIPETEWMEVTNEEFDAILRSTHTNRSSLYGKHIIEIVDVKPLLPKLKEDLLKIIEKEKKEQEERQKKWDEENKAKLEKKKERELKKKAKLYEQLKKELEK